MSVKVLWSLADFMDDDNPFDTVIQSSGLKVDLTGPEEELERGLRRTLELEGRLWEKAITCELKDDGQDCLACAVSVGDVQDPLSKLCCLGKDQFGILARMDERKADRKASLVEIGRSIESYTEMGHLPGEYAELLVAAGL